ncbi:zonadhesin-like [Branchiostoma floridae]|uniref:Zonadhesin-like n=1 Tax=Branchiostoma floridae TaxID=7739 RepID=A0A9J7MX80_BRAFL|nr:zonadhesin-like [Branchiostoma floridae]
MYCDVDGGYAWTEVDGMWGCHCVGDCCDRTICKAFGDPHFFIPDKTSHKFQGPCTYTFAKDCVGNDFTVETKHEPSDSNPSVSVVDAVYVIITIDAVEWTICILQGKVVWVNGVTRTLPLSLAGGQIDVKLTGRYVRVELVDLCVVILYDGLHQVKVEIPRNYQNRLCGLCGNFNGDNTDDYRLPDGTVTDLNTFGNSWQTDAPCDWDPPTGDPPNLGPCDPQYAGPCDVLTDLNGPFADCHGYVDPTPYRDACVFDMCSTEGEWLCCDLETYYDACMDVDVEPFIWRSTDLCPMDCPANSVYSPCVSPCHATCVDPNGPDNCDLPCVEGCECDEGYLESGLECVEETQCGCIDVYENYYTIGEQ